MEIEQVEKCKTCEIIYLNINCMIEGRDESVLKQRPAMAPHWPPAASFVLHRCDGFWPLSASDDVYLSLSQMNSNLSSTPFAIPLMLVDDPVKVTITLDPPSIAVLDVQ